MHMKSRFIAEAAIQKQKNGRDLLWHYSHFR